MSDALREAMKSKAAAKKHPGFQEIQQELVHKMTWGRMMRDAGRLTKAELAEFESHLASDFIDAMPTEMYVEMQRDGSFSDLEIVARAHDGQRHGDDVRRDRAELNKKVTRDALDEGWAAGLIDSKRYNQEHRAIGTTDEAMHRRVTDADETGDHDTPAGEMFFNRNLPPGDLEPITSPPASDGPKDVSED